MCVSSEGGGARDPRARRTDRSARTPAQPQLAPIVQLVRLPARAPSQEVAPVAVRPRAASGALLPCAEVAAVRRLARRGNTNGAMWRGGGGSESETATRRAYRIGY
eukprot:2707859-Prymnesium_polylepis.1